jgi:hypothetical protein
MNPYRGEIQTTPRRAPRASLLRRLGAAWRRVPRQLESRTLRMSGTFDELSTWAERYKASHLTFNLSLHMNVPFDLLTERKTAERGVGDWLRYVRLFGHDTTTITAVMNKRTVRQFEKAITLYYDVRPYHQSPCIPSHWVRSNAPTLTNMGSSCEDCGIHHR